MSAAVLAGLAFVHTGAASQRPRRGDRARLRAAYRSPAPDTGSVLQGTVTRAETRAPARAALVRLVGRRVGTLTDSAGRYRFEGLAPGPVTVRVHLLGAEDVERRVTLRGGTTTLDIELPVRPIPQEEITATARERQTRLDRFQDRLNRGLGKVITEQDLEHWHGDLATLLRSRNIYGPGFDMRAPLGSFCVAEFFVDGRRAAWLRDEVAGPDGAEVPRRPAGRNRDTASRNAAGPPPDRFRLNEFFPKDEVSAVEVIPPDELPSELATATARSCGAIVIWTRDFTGPPPK